MGHFYPIYRFSTPLAISLCDPSTDCKGTVNQNFIGSDFGNVVTLCGENKDCSGSVDNIFVDFDRVLTITSEATPACMAMYGPDIDAEEIRRSSYDQCGILFDLHSETINYAKWVDLKCNQRTRALMCTMIGSL